MSNKLLNYTSILAVLLSFIVSQATITGTVYDKNSKEPLIGATIIVEGTSNGAISDASGMYEIKNIEPCSDCIYTLKVLYLGYQTTNKEVNVFTNELISGLNIYLEISYLESDDVIVTGEKRQDKITDAPAAIEIISASDIKKEESTNLGSYLKGIKGVDFTSSGVNNYSISVRGFNSSFTTRLLTLTDGRIANIPALRVINYSTIPQSAKDIENIEVVLGPSTALYGANAHSGVVNITSKSPADSEGLDLSFSSSIYDNTDLYKFNGRWARRINRRLSMKISAMYLEANEWELIPEEEYKIHTYAYSGHASRLNDGKDNNPWGGVPIPNQWDIVSIMDENGNIVDEIPESGEWKYIGDGEPNDTGDPDDDGFMGEDWYNGYDDDGDGLIDEDYFYADGIDNDGDCPGDTNADGCVCCAGDSNVDEYIDWTTDQWYDGADNNGNGDYDETHERDSGSEIFPDWRMDLEFNDIIVYDGRENEWIVNAYGDTLRHNDWYDGVNAHLRGTHYYDEDSVKIFFDVYLYDYGKDGIAGDASWLDDFGDDTFTPWEGDNTILFDSNGNGFNETHQIASEGCIETTMGGALIDGDCSDNIGAFWINTGNDCGLDGLCEDDDGWVDADYGEGNGQWDSFDWNNDGSYDDGDEWDDSSWSEFINGEWVLISDNGNAIPDVDDSNLDWFDNYPYGDGIYNPATEDLLDCGQDGQCEEIYDPYTNSMINNPNWLGPDSGEGDNILQYIDNNELDGVFDTGDNCFGCVAEEYIDNNQNGYYDDEDTFTATMDTNGDGKWTAEDYQDNFKHVPDINGDGLDDYPDFEVKNSKVEFRLDYDPNRNTNISFQTGISKSKTLQVTGTGRYIADGYIYTYYQLRGRYKNWFAQAYLNQGNSGNTRGYLLGNVITDRSRNLAFQLQHNFMFDNFVGPTKFVWGFDVFRTEANTNGSILNDGPNGYDNDGDNWYSSANDIDDDMDSDDYLDLNNNGIPDPGEPGVNEDGYVYANGIDDDGDSKDSDNDGYPYYQEVFMGTDPYDGSDFPTQVDPLPWQDGVDEMIDEDWCGTQQYYSYVGSEYLSGTRDGRVWQCGEGFDEADEFLDVTSTEMGFYFQTKTNPNGNQKWDIITAARFDHHDQLDEDIQFSPKFGIFYKPHDLATFRLTYGKAYNTPSAINLYTDLFIGRRGQLSYYLRGNRDGTPYTRVGGGNTVQTPYIEINGELLPIGVDAGSGYWDGYEDRVQGSPYFLLFNDPSVISTPEFIPLDTARYTIWVPELNDTGIIYTAEEAHTIPDVDPIKTEKIQTIEFGFKGFLSKSTYATFDFYTSFYEDFFSAPTIVTPLIIHRYDSYGNEVTSVENINVVGMLPINQNLSNPPYGTQWDGLDNDNDWDILLNTEGQANIPYFANNANGQTIDVYSSQFEVDFDNPIYHNTDTNGDGNNDAFKWYEEFGWDGYIDENGACVDCEAEWGFVDFITCGGTWDGGDIPCSGNMQPGDTLGFTIHQPETVANYNNGILSYGDLISEAQFWLPVGIDEHSALSGGLSEAEIITSPVIGADGQPMQTPGFAYTPLHAILAPMNYGGVNMSGIDIGLTYFMPEHNLTFDGNFSFYSSSEYYNSLTKKNDPINAPKFKMNASIKWDTKIGSIAFKYRHVDKFLWKDGLWAGIIGPYDLVGLHYNYKINDYLEFNLTGQNIFNNMHKEMIGGATIGRQLMVRLNASL